MSSLDPLYKGILTNTLNTSQSEIDTLLRQLQTGLKISSAGDDPANLYVSENLNYEALENAATETNAQNGLTYLQIAQQAYGDIVVELEKIKSYTQEALSTEYDSVLMEDYQKKITESINTIKNIEQGTTFKGIQIFNNQNSIGLVNEHLFAVTEKIDITVTTATVISNRGKDYSYYLTNLVDRYQKEDVNGTITLRNSGGTLTPDYNLVTIETADELLSALTSTTTLGRTFILLDNINVADLGPQAGALVTGNFRGTLEGNGYAITGFNVVNSTGDDIGLFANLGAGSVVQNLILDDIAIKGDDNIGALAAVAGAGSTINNVVALNVNISGNQDTGGLVGLNSGTITDTYISGSVKGDLVSQNHGGMVGVNQVTGTITESYANVNVDANSVAGGLVGLNAGTISESYTVGSVTGKENIGGLAGVNIGTITDTYTMGTITGQVNSAGLVGENQGFVVNSYSMSKVNDSTTDYDINEFEIVGTGELVNGLDQRPNDDFALTYTAVNHGVAGRVYAFNTVEEFEIFQNFDITGTSASEIDLFYEKAAGNVWNGRKLEATNLYEYNEAVLADPPVIGVPIDADGVDYSVVRNITGTLAGTYAFKSVEESEKFQTYSTNPANTTDFETIDKFYKLSAAQDRWYLQDLTITPDAITYSKVDVTEPDSDRVNRPVTAGFNVLHNDGGTIYAFNTEEDRQQYIDGEGIIELYYRENADGTWRAWEQTSTFSPVVVTGATKADDPQDNMEHYTYLTTSGSYTYAFSSQEDLDTFNGGTPTDTIAKYFRKTTADTGATPWTAYEVTQTDSYTNTALLMTDVESVPYDNELYFTTVVGATTYAFQSESDAYNFNDGVNFRGTIGEYYEKIGNGPDANWQRHTIIATLTNQAYADNLVGPTVNTAPVGDNGVIYNVIRDIAGVNYAFATEDDAENFTMDIENFKGTCYIDFESGGINTWQRYMSFLSQTDLNDDPTGDMNYAMPDAVDELEHEFSFVYRQDTGPGYYYLYAFTSEADYQHYRNRTFREEESGDITFYKRLFNPSGVATSNWEKYENTFDEDYYSVNIVTKTNASDRIGSVPLNTNFNYVEQIGADFYAFENLNDYNDYISAAGDATKLRDGFTTYKYDNGLTNWFKQTVVTDPQNPLIYNSFVGIQSYHEFLVPDDDSFRVLEYGINYYTGAAEALRAFKSEADRDLFYDSETLPEGIEFYEYDNTDQTWTKKIVEYQWSLQSSVPLSPDVVGFTYAEYGNLRFFDVENGQIGVDPFYQYMGDGNWQYYDSSGTPSGGFVGSNPNDQNLHQYVTELLCRNEDGNYIVAYFKDPYEKNLYEEYLDTGVMNNTSEFIYYWDIAANGYHEMDDYVNLRKSKLTYKFASDTTVKSVPITGGTDFKEYTLSDGEKYYFKSYRDSLNYQDYLSGILSTTDPDRKDDFIFYKAYTDSSNPAVYEYYFGSYQTANNSWDISTVVTPPGVIDNPEYDFIRSYDTDTYIFANEADYNAFVEYKTNGHIDSSYSIFTNDFIFYKYVGSVMGAAPKVEVSNFYVNDEMTHIYKDTLVDDTLTASRPSDMQYQYYDGLGKWFMSEGDSQLYWAGNATEHAVTYYELDTDGEYQRYLDVYTTDANGWYFGVVDMKPNDNDYNIAYYSGGVGQYYFENEIDKINFEKTLANPMYGADLTYYFMSDADIAANSRTWSLHHFHRDPARDVLSETDNGTVSSRPNDLEFSNWSNGGCFGDYAGSTAGAAYNGRIFFKNQNDKVAYESIRNGGNPSVEPFEVYKFDGTAWDKRLISPISTYNLNQNPVANTKPSPNVQGFEVVNRISGTDYAFETEADLAAYQAYTLGTLGYEINLTYYARTSANEWTQYTLATGNPVFSNTNLGTNVGGRPTKEGYEAIDNGYAFLNQQDMQIFNNGAPTGTIDMFYQYNSGSHMWDAVRIIEDPQTYTRTYHNTASFVMGRPDNEDFATIHQYSGNFYAFKSIAERDIFLDTITQTTPDPTQFEPIERYYRYNTGTNQWQAYEMQEDITQEYDIVANSTPIDGDVGEDYRPNINDDYSYLLTIAAGANAGMYAFQSAAERTSFFNFDAGADPVEPIVNYYKLNTGSTSNDPVTGKAIYQWDGQTLQYNNDVGYLVGNNDTGSITNSFYGNGRTSSLNVVGDDGVRILGNPEISSKVAPMTAWNNTTVWDFTTSKPTLRDAKDEGADLFSVKNLNNLDDETKYVFRTYEEYETNDVKINTSLSQSGTFTIATPASPPVGTDLGGRPLVSTLNIATFSGKYISNLNVTDNADPNHRFIEGRDFVLYTNDSGATWQMDLISSDIYNKTLSISYEGALTTAANEADSGFNIYLGNNSNLNIRDMALDLAGRLNFNLTRYDGAKGTWTAINETLDYMTIKKYQLDAEIMTAQKAFENKTTQKNTLETATGNIRNIDEAKVQAEYAKKQILQSKVNKIVEQIGNLQLLSVQNLMGINTMGGNVSGIGNVYQSLTGINALYNKNLINYTYNSMLDSFQ